MIPNRLISTAALSSLLLVGCKTAEPVVKAAPVVSAPVAVKATPSDDFAQGVKQFDAGQLDEASATFIRLLAAEPKMVNAQYNLGVIAERKGELARAESAYEAAHKLDSTHLPTLLNLGKVYRLQDKFDKAITLYEEALKLPGHEGDVALLNNLTVAYRLAKKFDKAEAAARRVLAHTKDNPDAYKNLALIYYDQGNYRLAEFISANAKKLDEKDPGVYNNLGLIYLKLDDRRMALSQFQKSVALSDRFAPGHVNIGAMALTYRDYETAEKAFAKALAVDPSSYETQLAYAYALDGQKGRDPKKGLAAGAAFEKVLALKADQNDAICGAGWAYSTDKSAWPKATSFLEKCKGLGTTTAQDQQLIDAKLKGLAAMAKSGAPAQPAAAQKEKPKQNPKGASMLDKVSDDAAKQEGTEGNVVPASGTAPATGTTPGAAGPAASPAPATGAAPAGSQPPKP